MPRPSSAQRRRTKGLKRKTKIKKSQYSGGRAATNSRLKESQDSRRNDRPNSPINVSISQKTRPMTAPKPQQRNNIFRVQPMRGKLRPKSQRNTFPSALKTFDFNNGIPTQSHNAEPEYLTPIQMEQKLMRESWGKRKPLPESWNRSLSSSRTKRPISSRRPKSARRPVNTASGRIRPSTSRRPVTSYGSRSDKMSNQSIPFATGDITTSVDFAKYRRPSRDTVDNIVSNAKQMAKTLAEGHNVRVLATTLGIPHDYAEEITQSNEIDTANINERDLVVQKHGMDCLEEGPKEHSYNLSSNDPWSHRRHPRENDNSITESGEQLADHMARMYADTRVQQNRANSSRVKLGRSNQEEDSSKNPVTTIQTEKILSVIGDATTDFYSLQKELGMTNRRLIVLRTEKKKDSEKERVDVLHHSKQLLESLRQSAEQKDISQEEREFRTEILSAAQNEVAVLEREERASNDLLENYDSSVEDGQSDIQSDPQSGSIQDSYDSYSESDDSRNPKIDPVLLSKFLELREEHLRNLELIETLQNKNEVQSNLLQAVAANEVTPTQVAQELNFNKEDLDEQNVKEGDTSLTEDNNKNDPEETTQGPASDEIPQHSVINTKEKQENIPTPSDNQEETTVKQSMNEKFKQYGIHMQVDDQGMFDWRGARRREEKRQYQNTLPKNMKLDEDYETNAKRAAAERAASRRGVLKLSKMTCAQRNIEEYKKQKRDRIREMRNFHFKAKDVPQSTLEPRYEMMIKEQEDRRIRLSLERRENMQNSSNPFTGIEEREATALLRRQQHEEKKRIQEEARNRASLHLVKSKPPKHKISWLEKEAKDKSARKLRVERRSQELLRRSRLPHRMQLFESKQKNNRPSRSHKSKYKRPKVKEVPDFDELHSSWDKSLAKAKKKAKSRIESKTQKVKEFSFTTDDALDKKVYEKRRRRLEAKAMRESKQAERRNRKARQKRLNMKTQAKMSAMKAKKEAEARKASGNASEDDSDSSWDK